MQVFVVKFVDDWWFDLLPRLVSGEVVVHE
jgi:hypothetical protein